MDLFSISQLSRFSGIKAHTIRIWEKRYNTLEPVRSEGNVRYYNNSQLRRLLNIVSLSNAGFKVSDISDLSDTELFEMVGRTIVKAPSSGFNDSYGMQLIQAGLNFDKPYFEKIFAHCQLRMGVRNMYVQVILPMLDRIGQMWAEDTIPPAQEHFISYIIKQKLFTAIDALAPPVEGSPSWLLFLPEDEFHEIGLLIAHFLILQAGHKVTYLGANVPAQSLEQTINLVKPDNLLAFLVHDDQPEYVNASLDSWLRMHQNGKIFIAAKSEIINRSADYNDVQWLNSVAQLEKFLIRGSV